MAKEENGVIPKDLLDILACPACKGDVRLMEYGGEGGNGSEHGLKCDACKLIYPIRDGIPVMLIDEALRQE